MDTSRFDRQTRPVPARRPAPEPTFAGANGARPRRPEGDRSSPGHRLNLVWSLLGSVAGDYFDQSHPMVDVFVMYCVVDPEGATNLLRERKT